MHLRQTGMMTCSDADRIVRLHGFGIHFSYPSYSVEAVATPHFTPSRTRLLLRGGTAIINVKNLALWTLPG